MRDNGGHAVALRWSMREHLRRSARATCSGPPPTSAGSSATPTSSTRRCWPGATTVLYEGKPVGTPDAGAFWRVIAEHGVNALFTAPTAFRAIKQGGPGGGAPAAGYDLSCAAHAVPGRRAARPRHLPLGDRACSASRSSTTGGRPRPAGRSAPTCAASSRCRSRPGRRPCRCPGYDVAGPRRARRRRSDPGAEGAICIRLPLPPGHACRRCGRTTSATSPSYLSRLPRLLPHRRRRLHRRGRLRLRDGPHRRRHQRRRAPALDRVDGGGARRRTRRSPSAP